MTVDDEDAALQHPALARLSTGTTVGAGVRRGAIWALAARLGSQLAQLLGTLVTARLLLPSDYGKAAVVFPITAFAVIFTNLGLGSAVIHARRVTEKNLSTAFWINVATGVAVTLVICGLSFPLAALFHEDELVPLLCLASLAFTLDMGIVHTALLERTFRFKQIAVVETGCTVLQFTVVALAAWAGAGAFSLVYGSLVYAVSRTACVWAIVRYRPRARPDRESARELWSFSKGLTGYGIVNFWSRNADNLVLARFVSQTDLGNYNRAYNLMRLPVYQMNTMMGRLLFPALTRLRDDRDRLGRAWLRATVAAITWAAPVTLLMAVAAPALVEVLLGRRWLGMVPVLQILSASALPQVITATVPGLLRATGSTGLLFRLSMLGAAMSFAAIAIGLPWGTRGVATALMVKFYLEVPLAVGAGVRHTKLGIGDVVRASRGVWLACAALVLVGLALRMGLHGLAAWQLLLLQVGAGGAAYLAALAVFAAAALASALEVVRRARPGGAT